MSKLIDAADLRILSAVQQDGTLSVNETAERVHMSANACWRRIKRLEQDGVISARVAIVDAAALGLTVSAFVRIRLVDNQRSATCSFIDVCSRMDEVVEIVTTFNDSNYLLRTYCKSLEDHAAMINRISAQFAPAAVSSEFVMREHYRTTALPTS